MFCRTLAVVAAALLLFACGRREPPATNEPIRGRAIESAALPSGAPAAELIGSPRANAADMDATASEQALDRAYKELGDALSLAAPDCNVVRSLRDRICDLAEHICRLAAADPEIKIRCDDGRIRCSDAKTRVGVQCP